MALIPNRQLFFATKHFITPAIEAKLTTKPMTIEDIINLIPIDEPKKR